MQFAIKVAKTAMFHLFVEDLVMNKQGRKMDGDSKRTLLVLAASLCVN